jgi:hypothetical protein
LPTVPTSTPDGPTRNLQLPDDGGIDTHHPITEFASAVYRLEADEIVEYWVQIDRFDTLRQLHEI